SLGAVAALAHLVPGPGSGGLAYAANESARGGHQHGLGHVLVVDPGGQASACAQQDHDQRVIVMGVDHWISSSSGASLSHCIWKPIMRGLPGIWEKLMLRTTSR